MYRKTSPRAGNLGLDVPQDGQIDHHHQAMRRALRARSIMPKADDGQRAASADHDVVAGEGSPPGRRRSTSAPKNARPAPRRRLRVRLAIWSACGAFHRRSGRRTARSSRQPHEQHPLVGPRSRRCARTDAPPPPPSTCWRRWPWWSGLPFATEKVRWNSNAAWCRGAIYSSAWRGVLHLAEDLPITIESSPLATRNTWHRVAIWGKIVPWGDGSCKARPGGIRQTSRQHAGAAG